jgi:ABC-type sugar transport system ATPase subunit
MLQSAPVGEIVLNHISMQLPNGVIAVNHPLSNLDAKLRLGMRQSLHQVHSRIGAATGCVTDGQASR